MVCDVAEVASGVGVVWVRRDGAGVVAVLLSVAEVAPGTAVSTDVAAAPTVLAFAGSVWVVLAGATVLLLVAVFAAGVLALAPSLASPVSLVAASA